MYAVFVGSPPYTFPPIAPVWTRSPENPILEPADPWEQTSIQEPDVHYVGPGDWRMWAKGGWGTTGLGYYTSADGVAWTPHGSNPVLGGGGSGFAPEISQPCIFKDGATFYCYFNSGGDSDPNTPRYATSADGIAWTVGGAGTYVTNPGAITQWGNRTVWKEGSNWYMLQEARSGGRWKIYYLTSANGTSWTIGNSSNPLTTLAVVAGGTYGGPTVAEVDGVLTPKIGSVYHLWYHATPLTGVDTPTNIYHSTSTDRITWTTPTLVLSRLGTGDEMDQIADPSVVQVGSQSYLYYAGVNNTAETGVILLATSP